MRRDLDLSRSILAFVEEQAPPGGGVLNKPLAVEGYDRPTVLAHAELLIDEGLLDGRALRAGVSIMDVVIIRLTAAGHDAIAATKNDGAWHQAKQLAGERGGALTLSIVVEVLKAEMRRHLGLPFPDRAALADVLASRRERSLRIFRRY